jgi:hypothetical protein
MSITTEAINPTLLTPKINRHLLMLYLGRLHTSPNKIIL